MNYKKYLIGLIVGIGILIVTSVSYSVIFADHNHSGRTDKSGCHNDYKSGGYHCH